MRKLLTFLIALGAIVFAVVSPVSANGVLILASRPATPNHIALDGTSARSDATSTTATPTLTTANAGDFIILTSVLSPLPPERFSPDGQV